MDTQTIIAELEHERDHLDQAIAALRRAGIGKARSRKRGRRRLSAAARKRISEAMKKKWAARKRGAA